MPGRSGQRGQRGVPPGPAVGEEASTPSTAAPRNVPGAPVWARAGSTPPSTAVPITVTSATHRAHLQAAHGATCSPGSP